MRPPCPIGVTGEKGIINLRGSRRAGSDRFHVTSARHLSVHVERFGNDFPASASSAIHVVGDEPSLCRVRRQIVINRIAVEHRVEIIDTDVAVRDAGVWACPDAIRRSGAAAFNLTGPCPDVTARGVWWLPVT